MILADQHRLDASRAELNAKNGLSAIDCFLGIVSIHVHLSQDLKSFLQIYFSGKRSVFISTPSLFRTLLIGDCFFTVRAGGMSGAGVGGSSGGEKGGIRFNIAGVSGRFVKLPTAAKRRCWFWGRIFPVRGRFFIFVPFCADPFFPVAGRVGSPSRPDCGEVVGSGVANVDGPLGDRTLPKATQRFYREASHSAKAPSVRKERFRLPTAFHSWGGTGTSTTTSTRKRPGRTSTIIFSNFSRRG
jgi:hypothetical protein